MTASTFSIVFSSSSAAASRACRDRPLLPPMRGGCDGASRFGGADIACPPEFAANQSVSLSRQDLRSGIDLEVVGVAVEIWTEDDVAGETNPRDGVDRDHQRHP